MQFKKSSSLILLNFETHAVPGMSQSNNDVSLKFKSKFVQLFFMLGFNEHTLNRPSRSFTFIYFLLFAQEKNISNRITEKCCRSLLSQYILTFLMMLHVDSINFSKKLATFFHVLFRSASEEIRSTLKSKFKTGFSWSVEFCF